MCATETVFKLDYGAKHTHCIKLYTCASVALKKGKYLELYILRNTLVNSARFTEMITEQQICMKFNFFRNY
jgi:hypothetical protein